MFLFKSLLGSPGDYATRHGRVRGLSGRNRRPGPLLLERLENRLCLSQWSEPVNLGPMVNYSFYATLGPALSPDGLSLYFSSNRPGTIGLGSGDIWVSQRASLTDPWGPAQNLGPTINHPRTYAFSPNLSPDGHRLFFESVLPGGFGTYGDIWVSWRDDVHDDFGWQPPVNLGPGVNMAIGSGYQSWGPDYFEDRTTGITTLYFNSDRPNGGNSHIYASTLQEDGTFGPAVLVPELNSTYRDFSPAIRSDGLEMFITSNRPGGLGSGFNIWVSRRASTLDPWSTPVEVGAPINIAGFQVRDAALSSDGNTMFFTSDRPGGFGGSYFGGGDIWMSTRLPLVADHFTLSAPTSTTAGQTVSLTLTAWDHYGNIATGYTGTVTFTTSDPQASLPSTYTFTAADNGTHTFDAMLVKAGAQSIKATDTTGEVIGTQLGIKVNPAAADHFLITAAPNAVSGTPFDITITALDAYGNIDTNYQGTVTFSTSDPDPGVVLPADYTFTTGDGGDNGVHTFPGGVMLLTLGDLTLSVTDTVSGITGSATVTVRPGP
jgi:WD40-like Beta Propeller Repeat